jgi:hypothetical protein
MQNAITCHFLAGARVMACSLRGEAAPGAEYEAAEEYAAGVAGRSPLGV